MVPLDAKLAVSPISSVEPSDDEDDDETIPLAPTATKSSSEINSAIVEVLELKNHIEFVELEKTDEEPIR